jgi:hypothetical protein
MAAYRRRHGTPVATTPTMPFTLPSSMTIRRRYRAASPTTRRSCRRGSAFWPGLALIAVVGGIAVLALTLATANPRTIARGCDMVDELVSTTIDVWLDVDTLYLPGLKPEDLPFHGLFSTLLMPWPMDPCLLPNAVGDPRAAVPGVAAAAGDGQADARQKIVPEREEGGGSY